MKDNFYQNIKSSQTPPYIIAEIGANHNGDMSLAMEMIAAAKDCGCDAVKFQSWSPSSLICRAEYERNQKYNDSTKKHFGSLREMCEKYYLREEQHYALKEYADSLGIVFCSSHFSNSEADLLIRLGVPFFKIASMDINHYEMLKYTARLGKPIVLSTGMSTLDEIDAAVKIIETEGNKEIVLLHCISIYPPKYEDINLNNIPMLMKTFGYPCGFSDHTIGEHVSVASIALGARVIEKHFTLDKELPGWDHEISADPSEMKTLVKAVHQVHQALGKSTRNVSSVEEEKKMKFRRSIVARKDLQVGHILTLEDLDFKRPGTGIRPDELRHVILKELKKDVLFDQMLSWDDLKA